MTERFQAPDGSCSKIDTRARCGKCYVDQGKNYGTPLMSKTISVYHRDRENTPVARITVCPRCWNQYDLIILPAGDALHITQSQIRAIVNRSGCSSFNLEEIKGPTRTDVTGGTRQPENAEVVNDLF